MEIYEKNTGAVMSRVINPDNTGSERTRLSKTIVIAIRELMKQQEPNDISRDLIAYILMSLDRIFETVDISVEAWEKRGYWIKADRFRMDWDWSKILADRLRPYVLTENYSEIIPIVVEIAQVFSTIKIAEHHRFGTPWVGSWQVLQNMINSKSE
jgi:hypothetical protein